MRSKQTKRRFGQRLLAAAMTACMLAALTPTAAFAAEGETASETPIETVTPDEQATPEQAEEAPVMLLAENDTADDDSFALWFNPDGSTSVTAGQQGSYTVYVLENMTANSNSYTIDSSTYYSVKGSNNPTVNGDKDRVKAGELPNQGAVVYVTVPADGEVTIYGKTSSSKTVYTVVTEGDDIITSTTSAGTDAMEAYTATVIAGQSLYVYAAGSKMEYLGVVFTAKPEEEPDPEPTPSEPVTPEQGETDDRAWQFTYFGTSTSATTNTLANPDEVDGISKPVTLTSATYNEDGTISKKGGKFVADAPADGESFYYTTIDPTTENFKLTADVTIDYINPAPDGQEGFALMLRDTISGSGSYFSNTVSVTGTKLPNPEDTTQEIKDLVGVRNYTGISYSEDAANNDVKATRLGFSSETIEQGKTYRVSLEKTSYAYIATQYAINADNSTGDVIGQYIQYIPAKDASATSVSSYSELDDPMTVQEANTAYLALVVARGCNATFSNIEFTTSAWSASEWQVQPTTYVDPVYQITSPATVAEDTYNLVFSANADGTAAIYADDAVVAENVAVKNGEAVTQVCPVNGDSTTYKVIFTPDADFAFSVYEKLSDYSTQTITKTVTYRTVGTADTIYVAPAGSAANDGTGYDSAVDLQTALDYATAGQTILLQAGTYTVESGLTVARGRDGTAKAPITVKGDGGYATIDFNKQGTGLTAWGNYWNFSFINITNSKDKYKGMQLSGSHCTLERMNFYNNGNSGLQISGSSSESIDQWPSYNTVLNCTSMNNADSGYEDADGFAAKLTAGVGNVFDGCISAYNADDGWDLFAKAATGSIGAVTIQNCVAYKNGCIMTQTGSTAKAVKFAKIVCDENGTLSFSGEAIETEAGNGNGFKMGGTNLPGNHKLINSISYENAAKGIDSNSCTDIKAYNSTAYNNGGYNVAMYTGNKSAVTDYKAEGVLSFRKGTNIKEQLALQSQSSTDVYGETNYYWDTDTQTSTNSAGAAVSEDWFISLDTSAQPTRNADGSIDMHGLLLLTEDARAATYNAVGAQGSAWGQSDPETATIWVVGDSTVSAFSDNYYLPREGYGEELSSYLNATVYNLAHSGASSKDYTTMSEYTTLLNGTDEIPAMGSASGQQFLLIGFGHNDEKTEAARYTNPNGDYKTAGSFANSLYENYIKPALEAGVTPIVCTPIVRLTDDNTAESYNSASGHITTDTVVGDTTFEGGDYAQAIRDMCAELDIDCIDLTALTIEKNVALGSEAQWMHSFTGAKKAEDGTVTPTGLDKTHTNSYGAKMNAWLIANADSALSAYSKGKPEPTYAADYEAAINPDYVFSTYTAPTTTSTLWDAFTDTDGNVWYGSVFGNVGGADKITGGDFTSVVDAENSTVTLGVANNRGKIASAVDGLMMYYIQLPAGTSFTLTAKATVNSLAKNNQVSFGLMARDDMYIDTSLSDTIGDYVAAGTRNQGAVAGFGRKSGALYDNPTAATYVYGAGDTVDLKIVGTSDGFTLTYGENDPVSAGFDYPLTAIDSDYIYVGFYVARNANVTFSDIHLVQGTVTPEPAVYTVTVTDSLGNTQATAAVTEGETYTLPEPASYDGYTFEGWYISETRYSAGDEVTVTADTEILGQYTKTSVPVTPVTPSKPSTPAAPILNAFRAIRSIVSGIFGRLFPRWL